jgi:IPT/TIG domain/Bacterial Ig-like domain (group 2)
MQMKCTEKIIVSMLALLPSMFVAKVGQAQQPLLQITAPASGALATEGTTVTITVSADPSVQNVGVIAQNPLPFPQATTTVNQFTMTLPTTIAPGFYNLTAVGTNASGDVESAPAAIDVEPQFLGAISVNPTVLTLNSVGDQYPLHVIGTYSNGTTLDVTHSTQLAYSSFNTQIATVSSSGMITAVAAGRTYIVVQENGSTAAAAYVTVLPQPPTGTPPVLTSVTPTIGIPGVTQVTVTGSGFGATQGNGFVQLGTQNGTVSSWSDTQIVATVATSARSAVASVNQNGLYSNTMPFTISTPVIQGISPLAVSPGTQMTITGSGFGTTQNGFVATYNTNGNVVSWSDTQIVITVAQGTSQGQLYVQQGGVNSNMVNFAMIPPTITGVSPSAVSPGMQLTITGTNFGSVQNGFVALYNTNGMVASWSNTQIVVTVPQGTDQGNLYVQQNGAYSNAFPFQMIAPTITGVSPSAVSPGMQLTITGTNFGSVQNGFVALYNTNGLVVSWSNTQIVVTVPQGTDSGQLCVQQNGVTSNAASFTVSD